MLFDDRSSRPATTFSDMRPFTPRGSQKRKRKRANDVRGGLRDRVDADMGIGAAGIGASCLAELIAHRRLLRLDAAGRLPATGQLTAVGKMFATH